MSHLDDLFPLEDDRTKAQAQPPAPVLPTAPQRDDAPSPLAPLPAQPRLPAALLDGGKLVGGAGFVAERLSKRERRGAAKAARQLEQQAKRDEYERKQEALERARAEAKAAHWLPKAGEAGPRSLRSWLPLRTKPSRATTDVLAGAYPFLAEAGLGNEGVLVGHDAWSGAAFCFDPWVLYQRGLLTNPNVLLAGVVGRGKALAVDTEIPAPSGWTTMRALSEGDEVLAGTGEPTRVVAATRVMEGHVCYRVVFDDGTEVVADAGHQWVVVVHDLVRGDVMLGSVTTEQLALSLHVAWECTVSWPSDTEHKIVSVERSPSVPVKCIEVADPSGTFLVTRSLIPTHNSALGKSLAVRSIAFGRRVYVPGDPKGEWTPVAAAVGGQTISLGQGLPTRINPLDEGLRPAALPDARGDMQPVDDERWRAIVRERRTALLGSLAEAALGRRLGAPESTALVAAVDAAAKRPEPVLPDVVAAIFDPPAPTSGSSVEQLADDGRQVGHALRRLVDGDLAGLFDGPSTTRFDPALPMVTLDLSRISGSDLAIGLVMTCASSWMEAALTDPSGGQRWVIYDEAWRLIAQPSLLARMQSQWKLSRALGIANLLVIHRLSDLDAVGDAGSAARNLALGLLADCSTRIVYAQERGEAGRTAEAIGLNATEAGILPELQRGEGLWRVGERAFVVRHVLTPAELELFSTDSRMVGAAKRGEEK